VNETIVTVVGNVATDLRARRVGEDDGRVVSFLVVSSERRFDKEREEWVDGDRFSAWVSCWRRLGESVLQSLVKGDPVVVTGRLQVREYESDGVKRQSNDIKASAVGPDLARSTAVVQRRRLSAVPGSPGEGSSEDGAGSVGAGLAAAPPDDHSELPPRGRDVEDPEQPDGVHAAAV
jgi:single-strand DNA-binding protein